MKRAFTSLILISLLLSGPYAEASFPDVLRAHPHYGAVNYLQDKGVVQGYPDGTYQPSRTINRAEFLKIVAESNGVSPYISDYNSCFPDVKTDWYASYVCYAKEQGWIQGYPDGLFKPANTINLVEALKIIVNVFGVEKGVGGDDWYDVYLNAMADKNYIPENFSSLTDEVDRGEMAEMVWRVLEDVQDKNSVSAEELNSVPCQPLGEDLPSNIDMDRVRATWLSWYNTERANLGKPAYIYNDQLNRTATAWSEYAKARGYMDHKRPGQTAYYDYNIIMDWFANLGLTFANVNYMTATENIGWGGYLCNDSECTDELISAISGSWNFFMKEKGQSYQPHYSAVVSDNFQEIGLGTAISGNNFYLTVHYGTEITSDPAPVCK